LNSIQFIIDRDRSIGGVNNVPIEEEVEERSNRDLQTNQQEATTMAEEEGQSAAPLLEEIEKRTAGGRRRAYAVEGCPGCAVDRRKAANPGVPYGSFIYVWIVTLCTGTHISLSIAPRSYRMNKIARLLANNKLQIKLLACCCCYY
jgi:hypothetical protein